MHFVVPRFPPLVEAENLREKPQKPARNLHTIDKLTEIEHRSPIRMDPARWQQVERIYHAAAERPNEERASFLDKECAGDTDLRAEVERMLTVEADVGVFLDAPAMEMAARAWAAAEPVPLGSRLGPYEIVGLLGAGAMGEVYRARDMRLDRTVAIKLLPTFGASGRERFLCEARIASALNHPNIVTLHDIVNEGGRDALVMEYLEGETLEEKIGGKGLPLRAVLHYAIQIADGLAAAHAAGVVHRDVKPGNIMVTGGESGPCTVKVLDFGLAQMRRSRGLEDQPGSGTARGTIAGTVAYMSPEQAEGQQVDARSDLFSFGCVLYEMLAGRQAFRGSSQFSTLSSILRDTPAPLNLFRADVPAELDRILGQCLAKDRGARYQSAGQLHQDLAGCLASVAAAESGVRSTLLRRRTMTAALLAAVLASWLWHRSSRERWALETAAPEITRLVDAGEYVKAAALTREARSVLPKDPTLEKLWMRATGEVSIASVPSGANVSIRPYRGDPNTWESSREDASPKGSRASRHVCLAARQAWIRHRIFHRRPSGRASTWFPFRLRLDVEASSRGERSARDGCRHGCEGRPSVPSRIRPFRPGRRLSNRPARGHQRGVQEVR